MGGYGHSPRSNPHQGTLPPLAGPTSSPPPFSGGYNTAPSSRPTLSPSTPSSSTEPKAQSPLLMSLRPLQTPSAPRSPSPPPGPNQTMEGYMQKEGGSYKSWKKRYFVLKEGKVAYYADKEKGERVKKGEVAMSEVINVLPSVKARVPHCIDLVTFKRTFKFGCLNSDDKDKWIAAFKSWLKT